MEVILAKTAGFCFGVQRAVDMAYDQAGKKNVYTFGPIIHNEEVVSDLEKHGIFCLNSEEDLKNLKRNRDYSFSWCRKRIYDLIAEKGLELVDATCPFVRKIHKIAAEESEKGNQVVIIGNGRHPEVVGIKGWCHFDPVIIEGVDDLETLEAFRGEKTQYCVTNDINYKKFKELVEIISEKGYDISVFNTICNATEERQLEARKIASDVDAMIVIGGKHSSNTQKLYEISKKESPNTLFIQTLQDLDLEELNTVERVGITAGASTPKKIIKEVHVRMTEKTFEQLLEESLVTIHNGEVVEGTVIDVKEDEIILNIGYKADGIISRNEYSNESNVDLRTKVNVGDTMEAKVLKVNDGGRPSAFNI